MRVITTEEFLEKAASLKGKIVHEINAVSTLYRVGREFEVDVTPRATRLGILFDIF